MQVQETMTAQIANAIESVLEPRGVAVYVEAQHQCMTTRGVHMPGVDTVTTSMRGAFKSDSELRREFYTLIGK
jgi:GTP cyclohydrolase I